MIRIRGLMGLDGGVRSQIRTGLTGCSPYSSVNSLLNDLFAFFPLRNRRISPVKANECEALDVNSLPATAGNS
jgi:hypothetical protein